MGSVQNINCFYIAVHEDQMFCLVLEQSQKTGELNEVLKTRRFILAEHAHIRCSGTFFRQTDETIAAGDPLHIRQYRLISGENRRNALNGFAHKSELTP